MNVKLKSLKLKNFKGVADLFIEFNPISTTIYGDNGTGKTTIFDAFTWVLFGKNSSDEKDFQIKTLDAENKSLEEADHFVEAVISEDGIDTKFTRIYKEKWVRKRSSNERSFDGHETLYFYNDVPVKQTDYQAKVSSIIKEDAFKMLTSPFYFSTRKWEDKRSILFKLAGNITDEDIIAAHPRFDSLKGRLKSLELYKRELASSQSILKKNMEEYPVRVNELQLQSEQVKIKIADETFVNNEVANHQQRIAEIDKALSNEKVVQDEYRKRISEINQRILSAKSAVETYKYQKQQQHNNAGLSARSQVSSLESAVQMVERKISNINAMIDSEKRSLELMVVERDGLLAKWTEENSKEPNFGDQAASCPVCKQNLPEENIQRGREEVLKNFNTAKAAKLEAITKKGFELKASIERKEKEIADLVIQLHTTQPDLETAQVNLVAAKSSFVDPQPFDFASLELDPEYISFKEKLSLVEAEMEAQPNTAGAADSIALTQERNELSQKISDLKKNDAYVANLKMLTDRIGKLGDENKETAQRLADIEAQQYLISEFEREKVNYTNDVINSKFDGVKFKMYRELINGSFEPCCEILINGVPFSDANRAGQINAGISIINTFSNQYNIYAPIFIDNAEAVNQILPSLSQMVKLCVSTDPKLVIS
jgi:DNA repair exonuclease SbcCD ATPase subunit